MEKINEKFGGNNHLDKYGGNKRLVRHFIRNELWKFIEWILLAVIYEIKGNHIWGTTESSVSKKGWTKIHRNVCGKTDILRLCCYIYCPHYCYNLHWTILSRTTSFFIGCHFENLSISPLQFFGVYLKSFKNFMALCPCYFTSTLVKDIDTLWKVWAIIYRFN